MFRSPPMRRHHPHRRSEVNSRKIRERLGRRGARTRRYRRHKICRGAEPSPRDRRCTFRLPVEEAAHVQAFSVRDGQGNKARYPTGMRTGPDSAAVLLVLLVACSERATRTTELPRLCADAAASARAPRRDAGPVCVVPGDGGCQAPPPTGGQPDPANWPCAADEDCSVFADLPFCDGIRCSAAQAAVTCLPNAIAQALPSPGVAHTFTGSNGTFANRCDEHGNLIAYQCETTHQRCDPATNLIPNGCSFQPLVFTGKVVPYQDSPTIDCAGECQAGRCDGRCPQQGDQVTLVGVSGDGQALIHDDSDGRTYSCTSNPAYDRGGDFDCARSPAGQSGYISGRSVSDGFCTGKDWGNIGVVVDGVKTPPGLETCTYVSCSILPVMSCAF